jgi:hypothetical protein
MSKVKALFWVGLVVLVLGLASLVIPIPYNAREGFSVNGVSLGIETRQEERLHPGLSGVMIVAGIVVMVTGKGNRP